MPVRGTASARASDPDIFQVGDDGVAHIVTEELTDADRRELEDAEYQCPTQALRLVP